MDYGIGHGVAPALSEFIPVSEKVIAGVGHAAVGGALSEARGGDFWSGALSAGAGVVTGFAANTFLAGAGPELIIARTAVAAIAGGTVAELSGGTVAELSGGKFANGALTAAMQHLYNAELENVMNHMKDGAHIFIYRTSPKSTTSGLVYEDGEYLGGFFGNSRRLGEAHYDPKYRGIPDGTYSL